jgi:hypothetical protein
MHIIGTAHFVSRKAAIRYYKDYGFDATDIDRKIRKHEIYIGKPIIVHGEEVFIRYGRYHVQVGY